MATFSEILKNSVPGLMEEHKVPGAAIAVIKNYEIEEILKFGLADKENAVPISEDTVFCTCSISKSLTAWAVMRLVEMGKVGLDVPVEKYLSKWHFPPSKYDINKVTSGISNHLFKITQRKIILLHETKLKYYIDM